MVEHPDSPTASQTSLLRAWCYLVLLSLRRQARARQMVWIAFGLLAFTTAMTAVATAADLWHRPRFQLLAAQQQMMPPTASRAGVAGASRGRRRIRLGPHSRANCYVGRTNLRALDRRGDIP